MALWKESGQKEQLPENAGGTSAPVELPRRSRVHAENKETLISAGLTIEGKIEGAGHVRIAGCFKGDVQVEGNLTIESGAQLSGEVRADNISIGGEVQGNIHAASRVELLEGGIVIGDLKARTLTVVAGSRMRGKVEFGWEEKGADGVDLSKEDGSHL